MINFILICLGIVLSIILLQSIVLLILNKLFKVQNVSWLKSVLIVLTLLILGIVLAVIFGAFLHIILAQIVVAILSYLIFAYLIKKSDPLVSIGKKIALFISFIILGAIVSFAFALTFRLNVASPFVVAGDSMAPTYLKGDYLIESKIHGAYKRGDVVVFKYNEKFLIMRIIGLPNETVEIKNNTVAVCKPDCLIDTNKITLDEPYIIKMEGQLPYRPDIVAKVKDGEYFLLGDNRPISADSRIYGPIKEKDIVGLIILKVFNLNQ